MATTFFQFFKQHKYLSKSMVRALLERPLSWYGVTLYALLGSILVVAYVLIVQVNQYFLVSIPARGGTVIEGVIGAPHVINPVLATTETDIGLTKLLFSGLVRENADATITPDLAQSYSVSPEGLTYTFTLAGKLKWSDGNALTSTDVAFTISKLAETASPSREYWQGVRVETPDDTTVIVTLPELRNDFLQHMTIGIIPQHLWNDIPDELFETASYNLHPVGSGPYRFKTIKTNQGTATDITLVRNRHYTHTRPYIDQYRVKFFANQAALVEALKKNDIDVTLAADATTAAQAGDRYTINNIRSPVTVGVFHLKSESLFTDRRFAETLNASIDKAQILATVEHGYGILREAGAPRTTADSLVALSALGYDSKDGVLQKGAGPIVFAMAAENDPDILIAAHALKNQLSALGIRVTVKAFDYGAFHDVVQSGTYPFFFARIRSADLPARYEPIIPLYSVAYPFIHTPALHVTLPEYLDSPEARYSTIPEWYTRTNDVWPLFSKEISNNNQ